MGLSRRTFLISSTASVVTLYFLGMGKKTLKIAVPSLLWNSFVDASQMQKSLEQLSFRMEEFNYARIELHKAQNIYETGFDLYLTSLSLPPLKLGQDPIFPLIGAGPVFDSIESKESFLHEADIQSRIEKIYERLGYHIDYLSSVQTQNYCLKGSQDLPIASVKWSWEQYWKDQGRRVLPLRTADLPKALRAHRIGLTDYFSNEYADYLLSFNSTQYQKLKVDIPSIHSFIVLKNIQSDIYKNGKLLDDLKTVFRQSLIQDQETFSSATQGIFSPGDIVGFREYYRSRVLSHFSDTSDNKKISNLIEMRSGKKLQGLI